MTAVTGSFISRVVGAGRKALRFTTPDLEKIKTAKICEHLDRTMGSEVLRGVSKAEADKFLYSPRIIELRRDYVDAEVRRAKVQSWGILSPIANLLIP